MTANSDDAEAMSVLDISYPHPPETDHEPVARLGAAP